MPVRYRATNEMSCTQMTLLPAIIPSMTRPYRPAPSFSLDAPPPPNFSAWLTERDERRMRPACERLLSRNRHRWRRGACRYPLQSHPRPPPPPRCAARLLLFSGVVESCVRGRAAGRSQRAPHMHVLVCLCSNVRQFNQLPVVFMEPLHRRGGGGGRDASEGGEPLPPPPPPRRPVYAQPLSP